MSKRHQASRRRAYGRRQHELHERSDGRSRERFDGAGDDALAGELVAPPPVRYRSDREAGLVPEYVR